MTKVKICGLLDFDNALMAAEAGADLLGLNFFADSPRCIAPEAARQLASDLRARLGHRCPVLVGVFVNAGPEELRAIVDAVGLDYAQLSGDEPVDDLLSLPGQAFKAIRPPDIQSAREDARRFAAAGPTDLSAPSLLLDAFNPRLYGGTGETASVDVALAAGQEAPRLMLAGGLTPDNVAERVAALRPWGVDVASGVEAGDPGWKDERMVRDFIAAVRSVDA